LWNVGSSVKQETELKLFCLFYPHFYICFHLNQLKPYIGASVPKVPPELQRNRIPR
jgi:hypothetical protein